MMTLNSDDEIMFSNYISLGYFCSIAQDLERMGLRSTSSPFDWCISNFEGVIDAINRNFENYLDESNLFQSDTVPEHYFDKKYRIWFYHDFDKYHPLKKQLPQVQKKYGKRIRRFYEAIKSPTLFIRYISNEIESSEYGKSEELVFIEKNYKMIETLLQSYNPNNKILYIANAEVKSDIVPIITVEKDINDTVCRKPLFSESRITAMLDGEYVSRDENIARYEKKQKKKEEKRKREEMFRIESIKYRVYGLYSHHQKVSSSVR